MVYFLPVDRDCMEAWATDIHIPKCVAWQLRNGFETSDVSNLYRSPNYATVRRLVSYLNVFHVSHGITFRVQRPESLSTRQVQDVHVRSPCVQGTSSGICSLVRAGTRSRKLCVPHECGMDISLTKKSGWQYKANVCRICDVP